MVMLAAASQLAGCARLLIGAPAPAAAQGTGAGSPAATGADRADPTAPTAQVARATPAPGTLPAGRLLRRPGGFYTDDGPDGAPPVDLDRLPEPEPRAEALNAQANAPYVVFGREYVPYTRVQPYRRQGTASWYGRKFHGQRTSSGEIYDMFALTAAHPTLPIPSYARITHLGTGRSTIVRINDRGPFHSGRLMDVSYAAAHRLGFVEDAIANIEVEAIVPPAAVIAEAAAPPLEPPRPATPVPAPEPRTPFAVEPGGLYLQLGAFSNPANAENFSARVKRELDWLAQPLSVQGRQGLYRVTLGPFRDRAEAADIARRLQAALNVRPVVIRR